MRGRVARVWDWGASMGHTVVRRRALRRPLSARAGAALLAGGIALAGCGTNGGFGGVSSADRLTPLPACKGVQIQRPAGPGPTVTVASPAAVTPAAAPPAAPAGAPAASPKTIDVTDKDGLPTASLIAALIKGLTQDPTVPTADKQTDAFDALLDCYVGPVDPSDREKRLLRGHVIVTMLAMYGSYNLRVRRYPGVEDHAATMLKSITAAELSLSRASDRLYAAAKNDPNAKLPDTPLDSFLRVDRVVDVLQVAIDVERPTAGRVKEGIYNLVAAIGGSPTAIQPLIEEALATVRKAAVLAIYGSALRTDAYVFLKDFKTYDQDDASKGITRQTAKSVTADHWAAWDPALDKACREIASIAKVEGATCVPSAADLLQSYSKGVPSRRP